MNHCACHILSVDRLESRGWTGGLGGLKVRLKCLFIMALRLLSALRQVCPGNSSLHFRRQQAVERWAMPLSKEVSTGELVFKMQGQPIRCRPKVALIIRATVCIGGGVLGLIALSAREVAATHTPQGLVEEPRLTRFDVLDSRTQAFVYSGWVDFRGSRGVVQIEVANKGNTHVHTSGFTMVKEIRPAETPFTTVGTQKRYRWTTGTPVALFGGDGSRWPAGGTARLRFKAIYKHSDGTSVSTYLQVRDANKIAGEPDQHYLILSDTTPTPTQGQFIPFLGRTKPTGLSADQLRTETNEYYDTAQTAEGSIRAIIPTLGAFIRFYFDAPCGVPDKQASATYYNHGDLGLGRKMRCVRNGCGETACYVQNFGAVDDNGRPELRFGDKNAAETAVAQGKPFATVAMVEHHGRAEDDPNKVIFVAYAHNLDAPSDPWQATLAEEAVLDNEQHNTFIPGNCLSCHGIQSRYNPDTNSVVGAPVFLPFDLQAFQYFSSPNRADQEADFKALNRLIYDTRLVQQLDGDGNPLRPWAKHIMERWYDDWNSATFLNNQVPTQDGSGIPWSSNDNTKQMYKKVVALACRTCHISAVSPIRSMDSFSRFKEMNATTVHTDVCLKHTMPHSEQSSNVFWNSAGRSHFLNRWPLFTGCGRLNQ
jgi:hypothetical protein